jgi:serine/threonine protein kinase
MNPREFKERYVFDPQRDLIAEGTYSRVFHATDTLLQRDICIKLFRKELVAGSPLIRELSRAGVFFHPNVCAFYDLVEIEETNVIGEVEMQPIGIVEYMNGGMITDYISKHKPDDALLQKLIKDIIKGLSYLHSIGRPHLDLKPGNLLIRLTAGEPVAKITDFLNSENLHTRSVPVAIDPQQLCYRAPECFEGSYGEQTLKADVWSLGVMVYELVSGTKLFWNEGDTVEKVIRNICHADYWQQVHTLPEPYVSFVKKCLARNPAERNVSLEELTLTLAGYKHEERVPVAPATAVVIAPAPVALTKVIEQVADTHAATPPKTVITPKHSKEEIGTSDTKKTGGLSMLILLGAFVLLAGISAFLWRIVDDRNHPALAAIDNASKSTFAPTIMSKIDTSGIKAEVAPKVVHDTVRVVQIQQQPMVANFTAPSKAAPIHVDEINNLSVNVKVMPSLPFFDYLWVDKPYYFDLKTPLMSDEEYELYSESAAITTLGKNTFYVKPTQPGAMDVMVLEKGTHAKLAEKVYAVRAKSAPIATIGDDITGGFVSPKMLLAKLTMSAKSDNGNFKIRSFHMTCKSGDCDIQDVADNGKFNESMIKFLRNVRPGEKLYFDNIIAEDDKGQPIKLDAFQLTTY